MAARIKKAESPKMAARIKVAVLGDKEVGKTSLIQRYMSDHFSPHYIHTHGTCALTFLPPFTVRYYLTLLLYVITSLVIQRNVSDEFSPHYIHTHGTCAFTFLPPFVTLLYVITSLVYFTLLPPLFTLRYYLPCYFTLHYYLPCDTAIREGRFLTPLHPHSRYLCVYFVTSLCNILTFFLSVTTKKSFNF
jgi:hypothetical protein